ncbi:MAG TPA: glutamate-cysteine ligase family protein [Candidatus Dormibacteraeota bacterium]|nr:glutamate-cysteine ligase family protein [Candidatus Dormibacteraeota bacterium]
MAERGVGFRYGIEHEAALLRRDGSFADFTNTRFEELQAVVDALPIYPTDYPGLRVGDQGIKLKRWYVEGYERFGPRGEFLRCDPKGIEIRTPIHSSVADAVAQLRADHTLLVRQAARHGFRVLGLGFNPVRRSYRIDPELNQWERRHRQLTPEDRTDHLHMTTYGPDLNLSWAELSPRQTIDAAAKLTFYSPYLVPFSFASPFLQGDLWEGLSVRTFVRTGPRPAALAFVASPTDLLVTEPSLTQLARIEPEVGRIEFKAFDASGDFALYGELLTLLKGLILDHRLPGRRLTPDAQLHRISALEGFHNREIREAAEALLRAAEDALSDPDDRRRLCRLRSRLRSRSCPAEAMRRRYLAGHEVAGLCRRPAVGFGAGQAEGSQRPEGARGAQTKVSGG